MRRPISLLLGFGLMHRHQRRRAAVALHELHESTVVAVERFGALRDADKQARLVDPTPRRLWPSH